jgi:hypothetical protein
MRTDECVEREMMGEVSTFKNTSQAQCALVCYLLAFYLLIAGEYDYEFQDTLLAASYHSSGTSGHGKSREGSYTPRYTPDQTAQSRYDAYEENYKPDEGSGPAAQQYYTTGDADCVGYDGGNGKKYAASHFSTSFGRSAEQDGLCDSLSRLDLGRQEHSMPAQDLVPRQNPDSYNGSASDCEIQDGPASSDQETLFGRICDEMGLFKSTYGSGRQEYVDSYWNPRGLLNNCVFVSVGYILRMNADELASQLGWELDRDDPGVLVRQLEFIFRQHLTGCHLIIFDVDKNYQATKYNLPTQQRQALSCLAPWIRKYGRKQFAVGYQMGSEGGHCVVAKPITVSKGSRNVHLTDYAFMCYQTRTNGRDMSKYVQKSFIRWAMFFDIGEGPMQTDVYRGTESPGAVIHVNSSFSQTFTSPGPVYARNQEESPFSAASSYYSSSQGLPLSSYDLPGGSSSSYYPFNFENDSEMAPKTYANSNYPTSSRPAVGYNPHTPSHSYQNSAYHDYRSYYPGSVADHRPDTISRAPSNRNYTSDAYPSYEVALEWDEDI